MCEIKVIYLGI